MITNLEKYTFPTKNGKLLSTEPFPNGNMLRTTAEFLILTGRRDQSFLNGIDDCLTEQSIFNRYPIALPANDPKSILENTSVDDLLVVGASSFFDSFRVLTAARKNLGFYDVNLKRPWSQFIFRFQGMWQTLRMRAAEKLGPIAKAIWALSLYLAAKKPITEQDNWVLSHITVIVYESTKSYTSTKGGNWPCNKAVAYWRSKKTRKTYEIMAGYIGDPDHPLVQAWRIQGE